MSVKIRQDQIKKSQDYDDTLPAGELSLETVPQSALDDLNGLRSQILRIIGDGDWWREPGISLRAVAAYLGGFRKDVPLLPNPPAGGVVFTTPEKFVYSTDITQSFLNPNVYYNGQKATINVDYTVSESILGGGYDTVTFLTVTPLPSDILTADYFITTGNIPPPAGGLGFYDEGAFVATRPAVNFIGSIVEATDNPGTDSVDVTFLVTDADVIPTPEYRSHWTTSDGNSNGTVTESISRATARISTPNVAEGNPFATNGWAGTNQDATLSSTGTYASVEKVTGFGGDSTVTVTVYDADGTTVIDSFTTPAITGDAVHTSPSTFIAVTISGYENDPIPPSMVLNKNRANLSVLVNHDGILSGLSRSGGRFHVEVAHTTDSATDGGLTFTYTQDDVFYDTNPTTPSIAGTPTIAERAGFVTTKYISGLQYYDLGSQFNVSVPTINQLNRNTQRTSSMLQVTGVEYGLAALNQEPFPGGAGEGFFSGWTNNDNQDGVDWDYIGWAITVANQRFIGTTGNISAIARDPWANSSPALSANDSILVDTFNEVPLDIAEAFNGEGRREFIDGVGALASASSFQGAGTWVSSAPLAANQAIVFNGRVEHPEFNGVLDWSSYKPSPNPDYSLLTGQAYVDYGRRFTKTPGVPIPSFSMVFTGTFDNGDMLADLVAEDVEMYVYRIARSGISGNFGPPPGNNSPLRVHSANTFNLPTFTDGDTVAGSYIREGSSSGNTINCTFGGKPADTGFYWHLRIKNPLTRIDSVVVTFF